MTVPPITEASSSDAWRYAFFATSRRRPRRIQLSRARGWRLPANAASIAYPTKWANPHRPATRSPEANAAAVEAYRRHLTEHPELVDAARTELAGKDLACWCSPELPCHGDILLEVSNPPDDIHGEPPMICEPCRSPHRAEDCVDADDGRTYPWNHCFCQHQAYTTIAANEQPQPAADTGAAGTDTGAEATDEQ